MKIIIFQSIFVRIGGVETFTYNLAKALEKHYDILVLYKQAAPEQLMRLIKSVPTEQYDKKKKYECDICICASSGGGYPDAIKAKEYWQMIHADYKELLKINYKYDRWERTTKHIAVSNAIGKIFEDLYKIKCEVIHNILDDKQPIKPTKRPLKLISATRLSREKGGNRMIILANKLREKNIKFEGKIFTDLNLYKINTKEIPEATYLEPTYDIFKHMSEADYGVQLSDTEGYSYFINECLQYGTPVIATSFDSIYESVEDGVNGYILDMKLSNLDIDKIVNNVPKNFIYKPKATVDNGIKIIGKPKRENCYKKTELIEAEVRKRYHDLQLDRIINKGEKIIISPERYKILKDKKII